MTYNDTLYFESSKSSYDPQTGNDSVKTYNVAYHNADVRFRSTDTLNESGAPFEYREFISVKSQRPIPLKMMMFEDVLYKPIKGSYKKKERGRGRKWHSVRFLEVGDNGIS